jgi:hypothetical protein
MEKNPEGRRDQASPMHSILATMKRVRQPGNTWLLLTVTWFVFVLGGQITTTAGTTSTSAAKVKPGFDLSKGREFWAFQPMARPSLPAVRRTDWVQSPIDSFILAKLEEKGIEPAAPADRRALIRRATFDLTGLPPTPAEVAAFLADRAPGAFARVIDRLLESPQYGIRWGRHWLDVARYADSNGLDENVAFGNAWRYRDYVIKSINRDKPYNQFLIEQLAGDLLPSTEDQATRHERLSALGFLCIGPKVLAEPDKVKMEMDIIDEQIETLGRAFLGATFGCARCHDHKFDPIATEDYYSLAAIFKSTQTMDDLKTIAKWHEPVVARPEDWRAKTEYEQQLKEQRLALTNLVTEANRVILAAAKTNALPANPEKLYPTNTLALIERLRGELKKLEANPIELPSTMGVTEATNILKTLQVHLRGSHLNLGTPVPRAVPQVMQSHAAPPQFNDRQSGRLELARWLTDTEHPLTARVMVNRIWRWHFGRGLVASTDNFGLLGERPSHPELLDWLARRFIAANWSLKSMHRLLMLSSSYQMAVQGENVRNPSDPENRLLSSFPLRRLEAEEVRDSLLAVAGTLDLTMSGKTIPLKNREFVFDHTSKDATTYDSLRRAAYLPIVRNHLYDLFEQFDYPDPAVPSGDRNATVVAPQALLMMNSDLVAQAASAFANRLFAGKAVSEDQRLELAYVSAYGRPPSAKERERSHAFLKAFHASQGGQALEVRTEAWKILCQTLLAANEFLYLN